MVERQSFENVWDALENTPAESANMTMRSNLLIAIEQRVRSWDVMQAEAANRQGNGGQHFDRHVKILDRRNENAVYQRVDIPVFRTTMTSIVLTVGRCQGGSRASENLEFEADAGGDHHGRDDQIILFTDIEAEDRVVVVRQQIGGQSTERRNGAQRLDAETLGPAKLTSGLQVGLKLVPTRRVLEEAVGTSGVDDHTVIQGLMNGFEFDFALLGV